MRQSLVLICFILIASGIKAQDTTHIDSNSKTTLSFQPFIGLGLINGLRIGPAISLNDLFTVEAGIGISFRNALGLFWGAAANEGFTISEGISYAPSGHKSGLIVSLYHLSFDKEKSTSYFIEAQAGWRGWLGKKEFYRISAGYGHQYIGDGEGLDNPHIFTDVVLYIGALRIGL